MTRCPIIILHLSGPETLQFNWKCWVQSVTLLTMAIKVILPLSHKERPKWRALKTGISLNHLSHHIFKDTFTCRHSIITIYHLIFCCTFTVPNWFTSLAHVRIGRRPFKCPICTSLMQNKLTSLKIHRFVFSPRSPPFYLSESFLRMWIQSFVKRLFMCNKHTVSKRFCNCMLM